MVCDAIDLGDDAPALRPEDRGPSGEGRQVVAHGIGGGVRQGGGPGPDARPQGAREFLGNDDLLQDAFGWVRVEHGLHERGEGECLRARVGLADCRDSHQRSQCRPKQG